MALSSFITIPSLSSTMDLGEWCDVYGVMVSPPHISRVLWCNVCVCGLRAGAQVLTAWWGWSTAGDENFPPASPNTLPSPFLVSLLFLLQLPPCFSAPISPSVLFLFIFTVSYIAPNSLSTSQHPPSLIPDALLSVLPFPVPPQLVQSFCVPPLQSPTPHINSQSTNLYSSSFRPPFPSFSPSRHAFEPSPTYVYYYFLHIHHYCTQMVTAGLTFY